MSLVTSLAKSCLTLGSTLSLALSLTGGLPRLGWRVVKACLKACPGLAERLARLG